MSLEELKESNQKANEIINQFVGVNVTELLGTVKQELLKLPK